MKLSTSLLLLAGCVLYLQSLKSDGIYGIILLLASYATISSAVITICLNVYAKSNKE